MRAGAVRVNQGDGAAQLLRGEDLRGQGRVARDAAAVEEPGRRGEARDADERRAVRPHAEHQPWAGRSAVERVAQCGAHFDHREENTSESRPLSFDPFKVSQERHGRPCKREALGKRWGGTLLQVE